MTTPQNELQRLSYHVQRLVKMFDPGEDEDTLSIFEQVERTYQANIQILHRMDMLQDQMSLIVKLLSKANDRMG